MHIYANKFFLTFTKNKIMQNKNFPTVGKHILLLGAPPFSDTQETGWFNLTGQVKWENFLM